MTDPGGPVVMVAGPGPLTDIVFHGLEARLGPVTVMLEEPVPRVRLLQGRARRMGLATVAGQLLFLALVAPFLARAGRSRVGQILADHGLDASPVPEDRVRRVGSVNHPTTVRALVEAAPAVVVVSGTRIIAPRVLEAVPAPFVNLHVGVTPRYRGVHGGYWALAEGHPELAGTTVHLVDSGIDTGPVLGQATFTPSSRDTFATYPFLHAAVGLPLLVEVVERLAQGRVPEPVEPLAGALETRLWSHPTIWQYGRARLGSGVR